MNEKQIRKKLEFLKKIEKELRGKIEYQVCLDCEEVVQIIEEKSEAIDHEEKGHIVILQCFEHTGICEWIQALEWMLEEK